MSCHHFLTFPPIRQCAFIRHFLPVERLRTWHLARSIVASVTVSSPQSRLSVITCCRIFSVRFKHSTRNVSSHTFVSHVPFHRSALAGRSSDFVDSRPVRSVSAPPFFLSLSAPVSRPRVPCAAHRRALLSGRPAVYPAEAPVCRRPQLRPGSISSSDRAQHVRHSRSLDQEKA